MASRLRHFIGLRPRFNGMVTDYSDGSKLALAASWARAGFYFVETGVLANGATSLASLWNANSDMKDRVENSRNMLAVFCTICAVANKNASTMVTNDYSNESGSRQVATITMVPDKDFTRIVGYLIEVTFADNVKRPNSDEDEQLQDMVGNVLGEGGGGGGNRNKKEKKKSKDRNGYLPNDPDWLLRLKLASNEKQLQESIFGVGSKRRRTKTSSSSSSSTPTGTTATKVNKALHEPFDDIFGNLSVQAWRAMSHVYMVKSPMTSVEEAEENKQPDEEHGFFRVYSVENACMKMRAAGAHMSFCTPWGYIDKSAWIGSSHPDPHDPNDHGYKMRTQTFPLDGVTTYFFDNCNFDYFEWLKFPTEPQIVINDKNDLLLNGVKQRYKEGFDEDGNPLNQEAWDTVVQMVRESIANSIGNTCDDAGDDGSIRSWIEITRKEVENLQREEIKKMKADGISLTGSRLDYQQLGETMVEQTATFDKYRRQAIDGLLRRNVPTNTALSDAEVAMAQWLFDNVPPESVTRNSPGVAELLDLAAQEAAKLDVERPLLEPHPDMSQFNNEQAARERKQRESKRSSSTASSSSSSSAASPKPNEKKRPFNSLSMPTEPRYKDYTPMAQVMQNLMIDFEVLFKTHVSHLHLVQLTTCLYSVAIRPDLRFNCLIMGETGKGKSDVMKKIEKIAVPGTVNMVGKESERAEMISDNKTMDYMTYFSEEADPAKWGINGSGKYHSKTNQSADNNANSAIAAAHRQALTSDIIPYQRHLGIDPVTKKSTKEVLLIRAASAHAAATNAKKTDIAPNMLSRVLAILFTDAERSDRTLAETSRVRSSPVLDALKDAATRKYQRNQVLIKLIMALVDAKLIKITTDASEQAIAWIQKTLIKRGMTNAGDQRPVDRLRIAVTIFICLTAIYHVLDSPARLINNDHDWTVNDWYTFFEGIERFMVGDAQHVFFALTLCCQEWETPLSNDIARYFFKEFALDDSYFTRFDRDSKGQLPPARSRTELGGLSGLMKNVLHIPDTFEDQAIVDPDWCLKRDFFWLVYQPENVSVYGKRLATAAAANTPSASGTPAPPSKQRKFTKDGKSIDAQSGQEDYGDFIAHDDTKRDSLEYVFIRISNTLHLVLCMLTGKQYDKNAIRAVLDSWRNTRIDATTERVDQGLLRRGVTKTHVFKYVYLERTEKAYIRISKEFLMVQLESMVDGLLQQIANNPGFGIKKYVTAKISSHRQYILSAIHKEADPNSDAVVFNNIEPNDLALDLCKSISKGALRKNESLDSNMDMLVSSFMEAKMLRSGPSFAFNEEWTIAKWSAMLHLVRMGRLNAPFLDYLGRDIFDLTVDPDQWPYHELIRDAPLDGKRFDLDRESLDLYDAFNDENEAKGLDTVQGSMELVSAFLQRKSPWTTFTIPRGNESKSPIEQSSSSSSSSPLPQQAVAGGGGSDDGTPIPPQQPSQRANQPPQRKHRSIKNKKPSTGPINGHTYGLGLPDSEYRKLFLKNVNAQSKRAESIIHDDELDRELGSEAFECDRPHAPSSSSSTQPRYEETKDEKRSSDDTIVVINTVRSRYADIPQSEPLPITPALLPPPPVAHVSIPRPRTQDQEADELNVSMYRSLQLPKASLSSSSSSSVHTSLSSVPPRSIPHEKQQPVLITPSRPAVPPSTVPSAPIVSFTSSSSSLVNDIESDYPEF